MAYKNDRTERARLYRKWVLELDLPCAKCGSRDKREIVQSQDNCQVLCRQCNLTEHPFRKFLIGDKVRVNERTPDYLDFTEYEKTRPRTIISIRYDPVKLCNFYTLGSNGKGKMKDGQPLEGFNIYEFRSYQLKPYLPRAYHHKRRYRRRQPLTTQTTTSNHCELSQEFVSK